MNPQPTPTEPTPIILYGHGSCPQLPPVLGLLKTARVTYCYVNIHQDDEARRRVREINNGYESVPTLVFPDGSTLTEPSTRELSARLKAFGYRVPWYAHIVGNGFQILVLSIVLWAALRLLGLI